jgi:hypothetical protein
MSHTTFVSAVSGSLQSPRWPRQTCCKQSPQAFCVSPVSACPATSRAQMHAQIGLSACWFVSASMTVRSGIQRPREYLIRRSAQPAVQPASQYAGIHTRRSGSCDRPLCLPGSRAVQSVCETVDSPGLAHTRRAMSRNRVAMRRIRRSRRPSVRMCSGDNRAADRRPPGHRRVPGRVAAADARGNKAYRLDAGERPAGDESILKGRQI